MNSMLSKKNRRKQTWNHCCDDVKVPVFFPFLKYGELHLFRLNRHKPELRHKFRTVLGKVVVSKFSYKW